MLCVALAVTATVSAAPAGRTQANSGMAKPAATKHHWFEIGKATWYGGDFNGRKTANGETFDENELTCAHRTLPLGSWIRVTNLQNNRTTVVRVTDRGPWANHAVLDLSLAAARKLGFSGSANVRIDRVKAGERQIAQLELPQRPVSAFGR
jgi:rare lipoprotein A